MTSLSLFSVPPVFSTLIIAYVSASVFFKNPRSPIHQAFLAFGVSLMIWTFSYSMVYSCASPESAFLWIRYSFYGIAFIPSLNFYFNSVVSGGRYKKWSALFLALSSVFAAVHYATNQIYSGVTQHYWGFYPAAGSLHWLFPIFSGSVWVFGLKLISGRMAEKKKAGDFISYNQAKYVLLGLVGLGLGSVDFLPKYGVAIYPVGYLSAVYWCIIVDFAITRYRMLTDISFLTRRVIIGSAMAIEGIIFYVVSRFLLKHLPVNENVYLVLVSAGIGFLISPLFQKTKNAIDKNFFPEHFDRKEKLAQFSQDILMCKTSAEFNQIILDSIFTAFKITRSYLFIWSEERKAFALQSETAWGTFTDKHKTAELASDSPLVKYLSENPFLLHDDLRRDFSAQVDQRALSLAMLEMDAALCVPVMFNQKLSGVFVFGDKESGLPFSKDDIKALCILSSHTAAAVEHIDLKKRWSKEVTHSSQMNKVLRTYMSPSVADEVLRHVGQDQNWKGEKRHATILMSDLRGFTHLAEKHTPEEIVRTLNDYFTEMIEIIMQSGGTVDKFMGDAILAIFGVPKALPESEKSAVLCAIEMNQCLKKLNRRRRAEGLFTLQMGIGLAAGDVVAGNIGSSTRKEYTVIGDAVNMASRLQSIATSGKIVVTNKIMDKVSDMVQYNRLPPISIKGKSQPMEIIEILGLRKASQDAASAPISDPDIIDLPLFNKKAQ